MSSSSPATLQEALAQIQQMQQAGSNIQSALASATQTIADMKKAAAVVASSPPPPPLPSHAASRRPRIPPPTSFAGKIGTSVDDWLTQLETQHRYYILDFPSDDVKLEHALAYVAPEVRSWYTSLIASIAITTWAEFTDAMRLRYQPIASSHRARSNLDAAKQGGSVQQYSEYVQKNIALVPTMSDDDQVHQYIRGLKPAIRFEVAKANPKTLVACIEIAVRIEAYSAPSAFGAQQSTSFGGSSYRSQQRTSTPMDVNNIEQLPDDDSTAPSSDASSSAQLYAIIVQQQKQTEVMQTQLNALIKSQDQRHSSSSTPQSSSSSTGRTQVTADVFQRCMAENRCLKCKKAGHRAVECKGEFRLNF
jgi:hypothetical protein